MKTITLLLFVIFCFAGKVFAETSHTSDTIKIENELKKEILLAEASDDDEDLFMDDEEDLFEDSEEEEEADYDAEEETEEVASEPEPVATPEPAPKKEEVKPAPVAKKKPAPKKPVAKAKPMKKRTPANFKGGFKRPTVSCDLYSNPDEASDVILTTKAGKKLWLDGHDQEWYKGYHKGGHGYFPAECFE